ncbi:hypothetical protein ACWIGW_10625 [Nocardia brasiliensis]
MLDDLGSEKVLSIFNGFAPFGRFFTIVMIALLSMLLSTAPTAVPMPPMSIAAGCTVIAEQPTYTSADGGRVYGYGERKGDDCSPVSYDVRLIVKIGEREVYFSPKSGGAGRFRELVEYYCSDEINVSAGSEYHVKVSWTADSGNELSSSYSKPLKVDPEC